MDTGIKLPRFGGWHFFAGVLAAVAAASAAAGWLLDAQAAPTVATAVRLVGLIAAIGWTFYGVSTLLGSGRATDVGPATRATLLTALLAGGSGLAELAAWRLSLPLGVVLQLVAAAAPGLLFWQAFKAAPQHRWLATAVGGLAGAGLLVWFLSRNGLSAAAITIGAVVAITAAFLAGLSLLRAILSGSGWAAVARTVVDEAIRMRTALVLLYVEPLGQNDIPSRAVEAVRLLAALRETYINVANIPLALPDDNTGGYQLTFESGPETPHTDEGIVPNLSYGGAAYYGARLRVTVTMQWGR
jgi:hypothetical protein